MPLHIEVVKSIPLSRIVSSETMEMARLGTCWMSLKTCGHSPVCVYTLQHVHMHLSPLHTHCENQTLQNQSAVILLGRRRVPI